MYRMMGKHVTQGEMKALWIGTRNSFERFGDKELGARECDKRWAPLKEVPKVDLELHHVFKSTLKCLCFGNHGSFSCIEDPCRILYFVRVCGSFSCCAWRRCVFRPRVQDN